MNEIKGNILIIHLERLGDAVLAGYSVQELSKNPGVSISLVARKPAYSYYSALAGIKEVYEYAGIKEFRRWISGKYFDFALDLTLRNDPESFLLMLFSGAARKIGLKSFFKHFLYSVSVKADWKKTHNVNIYGKLLGIDKVIIDSQELKYDEETAEKLSRLIPGGDGKINIVFHPGGTFSTQRWPVEYYLRLSNMLSHAADTRYVILASAREKYAIKLAAQIPGSVLLIDGGISLIAEIMKRSKFIVCSNSGMLHLANAVGLYAVSFLGPTNEKMFYPLTSANTVFRENIPCLGCERKECSSLRCMKEIRPEKVFETVSGRLGE